MSRWVGRLGVPVQEGVILSYSGGAQGAAERTAPTTLHPLRRWACLESKVPASGLTHWAGERGPLLLACLGNGVS